ncbi:response regulator [Ponticoccus sp. SC2-23]|uniref:response regulator n=1 Tax=Alexandriicola marinus TaxID=2081710 RepID=UPI000FD9631E|nr:response regulator [Alexandriicola marinus]MBM1219912.1 response regulator [Ponticoccus sp. SC6-9]MBM1224598.1 response regulator [Ponticoccus sp. SC6-15]MBM1228111.1 response regulator [Ponticoccus sp. SC6-38]MBM1234251.1 response regulator [Ponticoccus sp. SC6-45]MBM1238613.1 response regulator [Ponticoccus sp. SC6-49]MBM1242394.1 response regulator [Ponticoccus sp. SC2-64]MBM1247775.1 response regulator [Ponticoccus sp. SC6-42]MBM1251566.1 response regulator [Ponticoccus sp. SC6-33]M
MDRLDQMMTPPAPTRSRPLLGTTFLLVEDSRLTAESVRLMCLRSGARIRRAASLETARRHLRVYRPTVALIDMTLPDGSGAELIAEIAATPNLAGTIIAISGDATMEDQAIRAGASAFILKPLSRIADFQAAILPHLPPERRPVGPRAIIDISVDPDPVAYRDDLHHAAETLRQARSEEDIAYVSQFLSGVAASAGDNALADAAGSLGRAAYADAPLPDRISSLNAMVHSRISGSRPL